MASRQVLQNLIIGSFCIGVPLSYGIGYYIFRNNPWFEIKDPFLIVSIITCLSIIVIKITFLVCENMVMFAGFGTLRSNCSNKACGNKNIIASQRGKIFTYDEQYGYFHSFGTKSTKGTVFFLHGNGSAACCWLQGGIVDLFAGYNVVVIEFAGYGRRSHLRCRVDLLETMRDDFAIQYAHVLSTVGASSAKLPIIIAGLSLGGGFVSFILFIPTSIFFNSHTQTHTHTRAHTN